MLYTTRCNSVWLVCLLWEQDAAGSSPVTSTNRHPLGCLYYFKISYRGVAQLGRALRSGRRGRKFKSCHLDQTRKIRTSSLKMVCSDFLFAHNDLAFN